MKPQKSVITLLLIVTVYFLISWFAVFAPYPKVKSFINELPNLINSKIISQYPQDLTISVKKGIVSINKPTPYCLSDSSSKNGIVFDPLAKPDFSLLGEKSVYKDTCQPVAIVGKDFVLYPDKQSSYKIQTISPDVDIEIDRTKISSFVNEILPKLVSFGQALYFIAPFVVIPLVFIVYLVGNLWYALVIYFIRKWTKGVTPLSFGEAFKLSLFFYNFILVVRLFGLSLIATQLMHQNVQFDIPFLDTVLITIGSLWYLNRATNNKV